VGVGGGEEFLGREGVVSEQGDRGYGAFFRFKNLGVILKMGRGSGESSFSYLDSTVTMPREGPVFDGKNVDG